MKAIITALNKGKIPIGLIYALVSAAFIISKLFDGFWRWLFGSVGLGFLVYLPILGTLVGIGWFIASNVSQAIFPKSIGKILLFLFLFTLLGILILESFPQVAFGIYTLTPIIYGVIAYHSFQEYWKGSIPTLTIILFGFIFLGALLDFFFAVPWSGFGFEIGDQEVAGARAWTTNGIERVSGFSRASYALARQALLAGILYGSYGTSKFIKLLFWVLALAVTVMSTTKSLILAWLILTLVFFFILIIPKWGGKLFASALPILLVLVGISLPISSLFINYSNAFKDNPLISIFMSSFRARLTFTWPLSLEYILQNGSMWVGRGLGGIGTPMAGRELFYSPADNMYVYLFGLFGLSSLLFLIPWMFKIAKMRPFDDSDELFFYLFFIFYLIIGVSGGIEDGLLGFFFGMGITHLYRGRKKNEP